jgi:hypothetical protein
VSSAKASFRNGRKIRLKPHRAICSIFGEDGLIDESAVNKADDGVFWPEVAKLIKKTNVMNLQRSFGMGESINGRLINLIPGLTFATHLKSYLSNLMMVSPIST